MPSWLRETLLKGQDTSSFHSFTVWIQEGDSDFSAVNLCACVGHRVFDIFSLIYKVVNDLPAVRVLTRDVIQGWTFVYS